MNQREFCVTQSGAISSGGIYGSNITDSYGMIYTANKQIQVSLSVPLRLLYVQRYPGWQRLQQL